MAFLVAALFCGLFVLSDGNIWERLPAKRIPKINLQNIPPVPETAETLETNFLKRNKQTGEDKQPQRLPKRADEVVLLVDSSGSIEIDDFKMGLGGLEDLLDRMKPQTNVAAVTFSTHAHVKFPFVSIAEAKRRVRTIRHQGKKTNTLQALKQARTLFAANNTNEVPGQTRVARSRQIFMVTDGKPNAPRNTLPNLLTEATRLKLMQVEIFILLIGENVDGIRKIAAMATSTDRHFFRVRDSAEFVRVVQLIQSYSQQKG